MKKFFSGITICLCISNAVLAAELELKEQLGISLTPYKFSENVAISPARLIGAQGGSDPSLSKSGSAPFGYSTAYESASGFGEKIFTAQVMIQYTVGAR